ncbi:MhpC hydrolase or acyltransferase alpha beta hydrolase superfamily [Pyrenophora tritici-repentis]|uniref:Citrinin biosynthesis oxidoreductase CtnB n=2 Tax=Pyrenophora tritici-repentis TaxID=45151 RepID=A0A2W1G538_9PLEO|nr:citrinin biosynthesis oxidoreductase CtnB [Pyrenophora tritici-repentis Pt-1C-BFP]KAA8616964.1 Citrinin biosynthesis oxidoreductase CtnB [Pyrenophora tritici-repentis]EDU50636.1 citrinin biosynthesis oxydoreductase CtnB [Pyrenophora tritici-repentis Pt-1C-BFP]KAF7446256.1 Citrinin biosynthesis oxidoreductase CtnB [Pyrenophora tritici-repentis]KAF7567363.1 MhpC, hydrolase or acyltransferase (alpha-beta hydrolase superfamily) [Pyrenophora tritici-repentis]KAG9381960.1 Citrinin biosynthesis ox
MPSKYSKAVSKIPATIPDTRPLPRILCLHGGGVNAAIFERQSRSLIRHLQHSFRLVWADAPFFCDPHPDVVDVYSDYAPFRRWLRWLDEHHELDEWAVIDEIGYSMRTAMEDDDRAGGRGEWVGLMGFSQGAKLTASLLLEQQAREKYADMEGTEVPTGITGIPGLNWRFGILLAGRAPPINLNPDIIRSEALVRAGGISEGFEFCNEGVDEDATLRIPTLHVHGMKDPGLALHRILLNEYTAPGTAKLVEWGGPHRIPLKSSDIENVAGAIYDLASSTGVKVFRTV